MPTAITTVPVTIHPEALAYAERLGLRQPMERMIEQLKQMAPELRQITVTLERSPYDPTVDPQICIDGIEAANARPSGDLGTLYAYRDWLLGSFPPEVTMLFVCTLSPGAGDGR